jgi:hypothetical protein
MVANIMGEDFGEWSELDDTHGVYSVCGDSTEGEMTDTSSDDMPPLVDAADDSDHEEAEVPTLLHNVVLTMPTYPISAELCLRYIDDTITTTNDPIYILPALNVIYHVLDLMKIMSMSVIDIYILCIS